MRFVIFLNVHGFPCRELPEEVGVTSMLGRFSKPGWVRAASSCMAAVAILAMVSSVSWCTGEPAMSSYIDKAGWVTVQY